MNKVSLWFGLEEGKIGAVAVEAAPEGEKPAGTAKIDASQASGRRGPGNTRPAVQPGNPKSVHRFSSGIGVSGLRVVLEPPEAEVVQPFGTEGLSKAAGQAVVIHGGRYVH